MSISEPGHPPSGVCAREPEQLEGMLVDRVFGGLSITPDVPLKAILAFRERHSAELGRLPKQIGELATSIPMPPDLMLDSAVLYSLKCQGLISGG